jgi:signal transduction histidine kinase/ligand-binding sensor domain-containing protein
MYRFFFAALLIFVSTIIAAQHSGQQNGFALRNYTAVHGLPQSQINSIVEDRNGYLWMATYGGGLTRFDGQEFKVYTTLDGLLSNIISHITIDGEKNLWMVHPRGLTRFDGVTFKKFQASGDLSKLKMVRRAYVLQDTVFIVSAPGVMGKIYKDSVYYWSKEYEAHKFIIRVHQLQNGHLLICLNDGQIILKNLKGESSVATIPPNYRLAYIYNVGNEPRIVLNSRKGEYSTWSLNVSARKLTPFHTNISQQVLFFDEATKTYWLRGENGLMTLHQDSSTPALILKDIEVNQVLPDSEGNIWLATNGSGLYKYFHQDFSKCSSENMRGVMSITKDSEQTSWIGTMGRGLWRMKNGKVETFKDEKLLSRNNINSIVEAPDKSVWVGTTAGVARYDRDDKVTWYTPENGLTSFSVLGVCFDELGNAWIGTNMGLNYFDGKEFTYYRTEQGLLTNLVNSMYYSKKLKTLFVGNEFGVNTITNGKVSNLRMKEFENATVLSIQPYRDSLLLFGSGGAGFAVYNPKSNKSYFINTHDGLISDFIYFITSDEKNKIWVGTEKGISRIILNNNFEIIENIHFDHDNGLDGVETNQNAFFMQGDTKIFGLIDGLYQFNNHDNEDPSSFNLHLTNVDIFYGQQSARSYADSLFGFFKLPYKPVFPSDKNHITFSFNRVDKQYPKSVRFKYMLKNFDKSWSRPSAIRQATYSNLPPGNYEFQVMATNNRGSWSDVLLRYPFVVKAPFYQTTSFMVIALLTILGAIIFIAYMRVRQRVEKAMTLERIRLREQESLRKEIARDFHDEMGNQLTRIINYISLLKLNSNGNGNGNGHAHGNGHHPINGNGIDLSHQADLYTKVENSAKYLYTGTRDFIWSIDPVNDELSKLFIHIRDFGEKLFEEKSIQFRANNLVKEKIRLPYGFSREVNLIFKEVMTNTFKYSQAKNATFSLQREGDGYQLDFEDDGIGFSTSEIEKLNGLKNIRERADKIQAVLRIRSKEGSGTKISLSFQFIKTQQYGITI